MGVSLKKGQVVSLKKSEYDLSRVTIGLGWDINTKKSGLFGLFSKKSDDDYDLDVIAFLCHADGKIHDMGEMNNGNPTLRNGDIVFFNSLNHRSGSIWLTGDNRTGDGDGDDEQIIAKLNDIPSEYEKIVFIVQIYDGKRLNQSFEQVSNAFIRAEDARGKEMCRFDLSGGQAYANQRSLLFAELNRSAEGWQFKAIGTPAENDSFVNWLQQYINY